MTQERKRDVIDVDDREICHEAQAKGDVWNGTPGCDGRIYSNFYGGGGVKCTKCSAWFCY